MALPLAVVATGAGNPPPNAGGVLPKPPPLKPAGAVVAAGAPKPPDAAPNPADDAPNAEAPLGGVLNDDPNPPLDGPPDGAVGVGLGGLDQPAFAAVNACFCASLSPPANIIPLSVPVKNVAIGTISSKNF